jgi:hypothetical protein
MTYHCLGADRFRDLTGGDHARLINRNQPRLFHSGERQWKRLRMVMRRVLGFLASQRVAVVASRKRRLQHFDGLGHGRAPKIAITAPTANRSRP